MKELNPENERIKRRYFSFLRDAQGKDEKTIDKVAAALAMFERSSRWKSFAKFHIEQAKAFKRSLEQQTNRRTGKPLAKGTISATLMHLKSFFVWLADQPGFRSKVSYSDAAYFTPSRADRWRSRAPSLAKGPTLPQFQMMVRRYPASTVAERRDRAVVACVGLIGARVGAIASLKLKHIDVVERLVLQDANEVETKNRKTAYSWFFPVGDDIAEVFLNWVDYLQHQAKFGPDDPLFPSTLVEPGPDSLLAANGITRQHWSTTGPIDNIFRKACAASGLSHFNPHSVRNMLTRLGYEVCGGDLKLLKAWSQNLGHERMVTTYLGYGTLSPAEQGEIMKGFRSGATRRQDDDADELRALLQRMLKVEERSRRKGDLEEREEGGR